MEFLINLFQSLGLMAGILFFSIIIYGFISVTIDKITSKKRKERASEFLNAIMGEVVKELIEEQQETKNGKNQQKTSKKPAKNKKED